MNIIYPQIEEYNNNKDHFYDYIKNYIKQFKNKKDKVEISYFCAKETIELTKKTIELTKKNKELYKKCIKGLELIKLWLKDENSINIQELKQIADSVAYSSAYSSASYSAYYSIYSILSFNSFVFCDYYSAWSVYYAYQAKPELLPYIQKLIQLYLRTKKQFNIKEHKNTYYESILKQIINTEYNELNDVDKNQVIDIINEYYDIEINCFDFVTYKTIQREFI